MIKGREEEAGGSAGLALRTGRLGGECKIIAMIAASRRVKKEGRRAGRRDGEGGEVGCLAGTAGRWRLQKSSWEPNDIK